MTMHNNSTLPKVLESFRIGNRGLNKRVYGGHGNGGKFYMRQMFKTSYFITYTDGKLNVFGFSKNKKYGFAQGYKNLEMSPLEAMNYANINTLPLTKDIIDKIKSGKIGFTVVRGIAPQGMINRIATSNICTNLKNHPQSRRLLERMHIGIIQDNFTYFDRLLPEKLEPKKDFEEPITYKIPSELKYFEHGEEHTVKMSKENMNPGILTLRTSLEALERNGRYGDLNRIDLLGEIGVLASYTMNELSRGILYPQTVFIYGDCICPVLEDKDVDVVKNDRSKLVSEHPVTKALLLWLEDKVNELARKIQEKERQEQKQF